MQNDSERNHYSNDDYTNRGVSGSNSGDIGLRRSINMDDNRLDLVFEVTVPTIW